MSASDVSPPFHQLSHLPLTLAAGRFLVVGVFGFACVLVCFVSCFASVKGFYHSSASIRFR